MLLRFFKRARRSGVRGSGVSRAQRPGGEAAGRHALPPAAVPPRERSAGSARPGPAGPGEIQIGGARARVRPPAASPARERPAAPAKSAWYETGGHRSRIRPSRPEAAPRAPGAPPAADGRRHCGSLERVLHRQWDVAEPPRAEAVRAIEALAELPERLKDRLAAGLDGIYVGTGGVPELDDMGHLRGVPLPSGGATWDICAGAYGMRKIVVGVRPSPTPDVMCHEIGHALDDIGAPGGQWVSDSRQFGSLYDQCLPRLVSDFHRQPGGLGRREFFADAFAAIASRQRPALVDMLGGDTRTALNVMLYFNRRYEI